MSGFAVGIGEPTIADMQQMMAKLSHRGPYLSGMRNCNGDVLSQNYLHADVSRLSEPTGVPLADAGGRIICYDGQMGDWDDLAETCGVDNGPFREERLILSLYDKQGVKLFDVLGDTIFSFVIRDGDKLLAARDLLGIKTLFYGYRDGTLYFASELKGLLAVTDDVHEFPAGHYMTEDGQLVQYATLEPPAKQMSVDKDNLAPVLEDIRGMIQHSFENRVALTDETGSLLSGGLDSSVICAVASKAYKAKFGSDAKLPTFAIGVGGESGDIKNARIVAEHADTDHHELIVDLDEALEDLPEVIYYLESFDPSLVRSALANFLITRYARQFGIEELLSGEGGDEIFCGYNYLKEVSPEELTEKQIQCLGYLHSNASLRLDRMNQCSSVRVVAPLVSGRLLNYAMQIPSEFKIREINGTQVEKWIFRQAYADELPQVIAERVKAEFSQGSGSAGLLPGYFETEVPDGELERVQVEFPFIRSKEEVHYFKLFTEFFGTGKAVETVGQWPLL